MPSAEMESRSTFNLRVFSLFFQRKPVHRSLGPRFPLLISRFSNFCHLFFFSVNPCTLNIIAPQWKKKRREVATSRVNFGCASSSGVAPYGGKSVFSLGPSSLKRCGVLRKQLYCCTIICIHKVLS